MVDAAITVAAIGGAAFTGGTSLALLAAVGAGAGVAGALFRVGLMSSIEGTDFDGSAGNVLKQGFEGFTAAALSFLGPEALGLKGVTVGADIADATASKLVTDASTSALFKEGSESILADELAQLSRQSAITGDKEIAALADKVAAAGVDKNVVEQAIASQIRKDTMAGLKNLVINETDAYVRNMIAAQLGAQGKELLATAAGFESPDTLWQRMQNSAISTAEGVTFFHGLFRTAQVGTGYAEVNLGRDSAGNYYAGEGTVVKHSDGTIDVVDKGGKLKLKSGDQIVENMSTQDAQWGRALVANDGSVQEFSVNGEKYSRVDGKQDVWIDKNGKEVQLTDVKLNQDGSLEYSQNGTRYWFDGKTGDYTVQANGKPSLQYNKDGQLQAIVDDASHTRLEPQYTLAPDGSQEITSFDRYTVDASGNKIVAGELRKEADGWAAIDASGNTSVIYGKDMHVNADGSISFTGDGQAVSSWTDAFVGRSIYRDLKTTEVVLEPNGDLTAKFGNSPADGHITYSNGKPVEIVDTKHNTIAVKWDSTGTNPEQISFNGEDYKFDAEKNVWLDPKGKEFAKRAYVTSTGQVHFEPVDSYRVPEAQGGARTPVDEIVHYPDGTADIRYAGNPEFKPIDLTDKGEPWTPKSPADNLKERVDQGLLIRQADGSYVGKDGSGAKLTYDADGKLTKVTRADGTEVTWKYNDQGRVERVETVKDGRSQVLERNSKGDFELVKPDGKREAVKINGHNVNDVTIESDGSITQWAQGTFDGKRILPDGVEVDINGKNLHESLSDSALNPERQSLKGLSDQLFDNPARAGRFQDMMTQFEANAKKAGLSDGEIAKVYYEMNKMLTSQDAVLSLADRRLLAEQFMLSVAHPESIDQGVWPTCNVTAELEKRFAISHPSELAQTLADIATTGRFIDAEGNIIDMTKVPGALKPQADAMLTYNQPFRDRNDFSDIDIYGDSPNWSANDKPLNGQRNFVDQILQTAMVNEHWQVQPDVGSGLNIIRTANLNEMRAGLDTQSDVLAHWDDPGRFHTGSTIYGISSDPATWRFTDGVNFYGNPPGDDPIQSVTQNLSRKGIDPLTGQTTDVTAFGPVTNPGIYDSQLAALSRHLLGYDEPVHFVTYGTATGPKGTVFENIATVSDDKQLLNFLRDLQAKQKPGDPTTRGFPVTIAIENSNKLQPGINAGGTGGRHVITITNLYPDPTSPDGYSVDVTNQWGQAQDHTRVSLQQVIEWMKP